MKSFFKYYKSQKNIGFNVHPTTGFIQFSSLQISFFSLHMLFAQAIYLTTVELDCAGVREQDQLDPVYAILVLILAQNLG